MITFLDTKLVVAVILFALLLLPLVFSFEKKKKNRRLYLFYTGIFVLPFLLASIDKNEAQDNVKTIQNGGALKCTSNSILYRVSKVEGWKIDSGIYFMKDSLLIRADRCEE